MAFDSLSEKPTLRINFIVPTKSSTSAVQLSTQSVRSRSDPFHVAQEVRSFYGAGPDVTYNLGHRIHSGPIVYERPGRSALRFLPSQEFFRQFLNCQVPVVADFLFLKALPCFQQEPRLRLLGLSDHPQNMLFFDR